MGPFEMSKRNGYPLRERGGSVTLEFALVAVPFCILMMSILGGSMLFWAKSVLQMTAAQAARCVAIGSLDCTDVSSYVSGKLTGWGVGVILPTVTVAVATGQTCGLGVGHYASVSISTPSSSVEAIAPGFSGIMLSATACHPSSL